MTITQLNTFIRIIESGSFSAAADSLGYAQSTVTTQIKQLEQELGCQLFDRLGKTVSLTSSGERLIAYAERMLQLERDIHLEVSDEEDPAGVLKIGVSESLCINRFPQILMKFNKTYPGIELRLQFINHEDIQDLLQRGELDIVYTLNPLIEGDSLSILYKKRETLGFYASPEFVRSHKKLTETDLKQIPLLLTGHNCNFRNMLMKDLKKHNISPRIALETSSKEILKQFAGNGYGVAFIPDVTAETELNEGTLKKLEWRGDDFPVYSQVIIHKDKYLSRAVIELVDMIKGYQSAVY